MAESELYITDRKLDLCPFTENWPVSELLKECAECNGFFLYCCSCNKINSQKPKHLRPERPCHHHRIVFTDGACINNGQAGAKAGIGVAFGSSEDSQISIPVTDALDKISLCSNQRAELLAARRGLQSLAEVNNVSAEGPFEAKTGNEGWLIATDSEYVARGMTEWLPKWKENNWRTSKGTKPANLDLFLALDHEMAKYEAKNITIGFWRIPREDNTMADGLAKASAVNGHVATK